MRHTPTPEESKARHRTLLAACAILACVFAGLLVWGAVRLERCLSDLYDEQAVVDDPDTQIVIVTPGRMVKADTITMYFGLTNGVNLARVPFAQKREELLRKVPNIRDLKIERRRPNRVTIEVVERIPVARVASSLKARNTYRVADGEGVVFRFAQGTSILPLIREGSPATKAGDRLNDAGFAALQVLDLLGATGFQDLHVKEIDTTGHDCLGLLLADNVYVKLAWLRWNHMRDSIKQSRESLLQQLTRLQQAIGTGLAPHAKFWDATDFEKPGRVYARDSRAIPAG